MCEPNWHSAIVCLLTSVFIALIVAWKSTPNNKRGGGKAVFRRIMWKMQLFYCWFVALENFIIEDCEVVNYGSGCRYKQFKFRTREKKEQYDSQNELNLNLNKSVLLSV